MTSIVEKHETSVGMSAFLQFVNNLVYK